MIAAANDNIPQRGESLPMVERVERALLLIAYLIEIEGDVHLPMYEQYEAKLAELRSRDDARARARQRLQAYAVQSSAPAGLTAPMTLAA